MSVESELLTAPSSMPLSREPSTIKSESLLDTTFDQVYQLPQYSATRKASMAVGRGILINKKSRDRCNSELKPKTHIKFRDAVEGQELTDIKWVESYKEYNVLPDDPKDCACCLL
eukprot:TRINITY_DN912_c0_g1_i1.p10 TRINITY_DN912_c0_g1~~TRINITY_DN912_c0_g1_i1.p10  ORF type:complete len:115 (+),score=8.98 TRINITY_DN912_c0_g1_i1:3375-3719(+)